MLLAKLNLQLLLQIPIPMVEMPMTIPWQSS